METIFSEFVTKAPELAALFGIVYMFLKRDRERDEVMERLHAEHLQARAESRATIMENVVATRENTRALQSLQDTVATRIHK